MVQCPACSATELTRKKKGGWFCPDCETHFTDADVPPAATAPSGLVAIATNWPSVISAPVGTWAEASHPVVRLWAACDALEMLLRFLVMVGVGELTRDGNRLPDPLAAELRGLIERPTLNAWYAMARAVASEPQSGELLVPELRPFVLETLPPFLLGTKPATAETSFIELRNRLAHGAGLTGVAAARLDALWSPRFEAVMSAAGWLSRTRLVFGSTSEESTSANLVVDAGALKLWPLARHAEPRSPGDTIGSGMPPAPHMYARRGEVRLEYTPVGSDFTGVSEGVEDDFAAFLDLFRRPTAKHDVDGFEDELRRESSELEGRTEEVARLLALVRVTPRGLAWLSGAAGVGKSWILARVATELLDAPPEGTLVLAYRFRSGDSKRCSRNAFLRFAAERLEAWLGTEREADQEHQQPRARLTRLLKALPHDRRVAFLLDGLDEIAERDRDFAKEIPLALRGPGVFWLCAGRSERGLPEAFRKAGAIEPYPEGLPRMSEDDVRAMLLNQIGPLRARLLAGDKDEAERVANAFVERVWKNADGLPIYVRLVINDVKGARVVPEPGARLPKGLAQYHEEILRRCAVGGLQQVLTPLAATLALAREPLGVPALAALLARRGIVTASAQGTALVAQGLAAIETMVRRAPDADGGEGFTLYHHSLRQHVLESATMAEPIATGRAAFAQAGLVPAGDAAERYLHRQGVSHLLEVGRRDEALALTTNLAYVNARLDALPQGRGELASDWRKWLIVGDRLADLEVAAGAFGTALEVLCQAAMREGLVGRTERLGDVLRSHLSALLEDHQGGAPGLRACLPQSLAIAERLYSLQPDNTTYLRDLSVSYEQLSHLDGRCDPEMAREWAGKGLVIAQHLVSVEPDNPEYLRDLSVSYNRLSELDGRRDPDRARAWAEKGLAIRERLVSMEPDNTMYQRDLSVSYDKLSDLDGRSDTALARLWAEKGLAIAERLAWMEPDNTEYLHDLSASYNRLSDLDVRRDPKLARAWAGKVVTIAERLASMEPDNATYLRALSVSYNQMSDLDGRLDSERARGWANKALAIRERLVSMEPDNTTYLRELSVSYNMLSNLDDPRDPELARAWATKGLAIRERLASLEPDNTMYQRGLSVSYDRLSDLDGRTDPTRARAWAEQGLAIAQRLVSLEPDNTTYLRDLSVSYGKLSDLDSQKSPALAWAWAEKGLAIAQRLVSLEPDNTEYLRRLADFDAKVSDFIRGTDPDRALTLALDSLNRGLQIASANDEDVEAVANVGFAHGRVALRLSEVGRTDEAREHLEGRLTSARWFAELATKDVDGPYNVACASALLLKSDHALASLTQAVDLGYRDADFALEDPDLASLRDDPRFADLIELMRREA